MLSLLSLLLVPAVLAHNISSAALNKLKRDGGLRFSNYNAEESEGACGTWNKNSEYVVALTHLEWNNGANCFKEVYITYNGMSAVAKIVDECMGCPWHGLDFSQSLFGHFVGGEQNNEEVGIIYGDWSYGTGPSSGGGGNDDGGDDDTTTTTTTHKTTTTAHTPTTTSTSPKPTTTSSKRSTTTSASSKTSSRASTSSKASSASVPTSAAATATASATPTPTGPQNMQDFSQAVLNLAGLLVQAQQAA
ncbi:hypothetical protein FB451DRAFT_791325 [Mycena latifolia]|nr:hypothetical protein FB451DRAFT_791325 [Mycena latifolia]